MLLGVCRGKRQFDKRADLAERDSQRRLQAAMKHSLREPDPADPGCRIASLSQYPRFDGVLFELSAPDRFEPGETSVSVHGTPEGRLP
jgi:hypothetical protein